MASANLTAQRLRELLNYDRRTGHFTRLTTINRYKAGDRFMGCVKPGGYVQMKIDRTAHYAHRLAWLHTFGEWPLYELDHINGDPSDNSIANLRDVNHQVNSQNARVARNNSGTGLLGAFWSPVSGKWFAQIRVSGKATYLGTFDTPEAAHAAYVTAKRLRHDGCTI